MADESFKQRVVAERADLAANIQGLHVFIASNPLYEQLPQAERERLSSQLSAQRVLLDILDARINANFQ